MSKESRFSPKGVTSACAVCPVPEDALRGLLRRRQRGGTHENETSRAGLRPDGVYVYAERLQGRANRPFLVVSPEREARVREADALAGV